MTEDIPAFPMAVPDNWEMVQEGMSLRDWFAGQVLTGVMGGMGDLRHLPFDEVLCPAIANRAYAIAQAVLEESQKYEKKQ